MKVTRTPGSLIAFGVFALAFALPQAFAGSPFYLTVERSFSNTEKPQVRLDYTESGKPMVFRVLRPKDLERFLDGQLNISRSYEQPVSELNPGHYFVKGLNRVESPLKTFREMLDRGFRKSFQGTSFNRAIVDTDQGEIVSPLEEILHGPPQGFTLVREVVVDLQFGAAAADDLGWWFSSNTWREDRYLIRTVALDPLPDGLYLLQAVQGKTEAQCLMQVSSLAVQVKQSTEQLVVRVINRELEPVAGASVSYRDGRGKWIQLPQRTNASGEVFFSNPEGILDGRLVIKADTADNRQALADTDFIPVVTNDDSVFMVTDRPIFKPGETFFYKGVVRAFDNGELKVPAFVERQAKISLVGADGKATGLQATEPVSGHGSFSGTFGLDEAQAPGLYRLVAEIDRKPYAGEFRVRDYVKPTFYLELLERSPTVIPGDRFQGRFKARRYSGGAPRDAKYEVFLYRKKFEVPQWVVEAGGGLSAGTDYQGEIRSASALMEPKRVYSSIEERLSGTNNLYTTNSWDSAPTLDESGEARFEFTVPKAASAGDEEWIYTLMVRVLDRSGSQAILTESIFMTLSEAQPVARFSTAISQVGEKGASIAVRSTYPDGKPAPKGAGVLDILLEASQEPTLELVKMPFVTNEQGFCRLSLPELSRRGRLVAVASLETLDGKPMKRQSKSQPAVMIVGGTQGESILDNRELELYTAGTILSPGDKAKVFALLPVGWGKAEGGMIWETLSGRKIYETRPLQFKGRSCWFEVEARPEYGTGFYHTVTVPMPGGKYREQTQGFRIIPKAKRLSISISPERQEAEPLKPLVIDFEVKDASGGPAADTELTVTIVDRAVYAVQSELRPGIFDFFYPLPRMNLATFYSDELQGYGYADILKKPNFKLGALKSQSKLTKKSMRDTAGWFPHVLTNDRGKVSLTVDLPANVTEWIVTAIAADRSGRVGEAKERFRTVSDITVDVLAPQFLRRSEEVAIQVKTVNQLQKTVSLKSSLEVDGPVELREGRLQGEFSLERQGEKLWPLKLEATGEKGTATIRVKIEPEPNVRAGGAEEYEIPLRPSAMKQVLSSVQDKDRLVTALPREGRVGEVKVEVNSGLLGAALNAAVVLVSYPYGCTEQLVHSTVPNLVLMDLIQRAGIPPQDLGPLAAVLTRAQKNAALGIKKITRNQKTEGGFGLWPTDPNASIPVTLMALHALKFAVDLKIEGAEYAYSKGAQWLYSARGADGDKDAKPLSPYELALFAETDLSSQPWKEQVTFVEWLRKEEAPSIQDLICGLRIFHAYKDKTWNRFNVAFSTTKAKEELMEKLKQALGRLGPDLGIKAGNQDSQLFQSLGFGFGAPSVISAAMGVLADLKGLPGDLEVRLKQILLTTRKNGFWISTFDTAQVILNCRALLSREAEAFAREKATQTRRVAVFGRDGSLIGELSRIPAGFVGRFDEPGSMENLSEMRLDGLEPSETAVSTTTVDVPFGAVEPQSFGLSVERQFLRITPTGSVPLDLSHPLHKGELVISEVHVRRRELDEAKTIPSRFLVIEDGVPSFAQAIDDDQTYLADAGVQADEDDYWEAIKETLRRPDRTVRIAKVLSKRELRTYQVWQVAFTGKATIPPARAFDMYDESIQGNTRAESARAE